MNVWNLFPVLIVIGIDVVFVFLYQAIAHCLLFCNDSHTNYGIM